MNYRVLNAGRPRHSRAMISAARRLRAQGNTYREIGEILGLTKDQVIGIAHRHFRPRVPHCPQGDAVAAHANIAVTTGDNTPGTAHA